MAVLGVFSHVSSSPGDVAQLAEHLLCKQGVVGSNPIVSTTNWLLRGGIGGASEVQKLPT
jgi:hypothetical protein